MNQVKLQLEYIKNIQRYCLNCKGCYFQFNNPNVKSREKAQRMTRDYEVYERNGKNLSETLEDAFLACFKPKGEVL